MIPNILEKTILINFDEYEFLPRDFNPSRYISIWFDGIFDNREPLSLEHTDILFFRELLGKNFRFLVEQFDKEYIFTEPQLIFKPEYQGESAKIGLKVGMMEREVYEEWKKK